MTALLSEVAAQLAAIAPHQGIIDTAQAQTTQVIAFVKNAAVLVVIVAFVWTIHKKSWAVGAIIGALLVGGAIFFAINGGLQWIGTQFSSQLGS